MSTYPASASDFGLGGPPPPRPRLVCVDRPVEVPRPKTMPDIRRQAIAAIEALLSLTDPESTRHRDQLRAYLEEHPGQPEIALAKHLLALERSID